MRISFSTPYAPSVPSERAKAPDDGTVQAIAPISRDDEGVGARVREDRSQSASRANPKDSASFSTASLDALAKEATEAAGKDGQAAQKAEHDETGPNKTKGSDNGTEQLTDAEKEQVRELKARDAEVRAHEAAHAAAAGSLASGGPSYDYQRGPDGANYAVGGEVGISVGSGSTPEERAANAAQAQRAANAPSNPSGADRAVAARAAQVAASARAEIAKTNREETEESQPSRAPEASSAGRNGDPVGETLPGKPSNDQAGDEVPERSESKARSAELGRRAQAYGEVTASASERSASRA